MKFPFLFLVQCVALKFDPLYIDANHIDCLPLLYHVKFAAYQFSRVSLNVFAYELYLTDMIFLVIHTHIISVFMGVQIHIYQHVH